MIQYERQGFQEHQKESSRAGYDALSKLQSTKHVRMTKEGVPWREPKKEYDGDSFRSNGGLVQDLECNGVALDEFTDTQADKDRALIDPKSVSTKGVEDMKEGSTPHIDGSFPRPSTPSSFKVSPSDKSDFTNDTSPSSVEYDGVKQHDVPENKDSVESTIDTIRITSDGTMKRRLEEIDPLQCIENNSHDTIKIKTNTSESKTSPMATNATPLGSLRRHTSPMIASALTSKPDSTQKRASLEILPSKLIVKSTMPTGKKSNSLSSTILRRLNYDSTNNEINRMRNSSIVQSKMKRKKNVLDDDKVSVGNRITEGHENFIMAYNMLTGIRVAVSRCSGVMKELTDKDFDYTKKLTFDMDGSELTPSSKYDFKFKDYCPAVFRELRYLFGIDPADYLISVTGKYILSELGSPGKSGSFFYFSRDYRFIIKTIHHSEHRQLRRILRNYYAHVKTNPNTLLSQFYGLHRVKMPFCKGKIRKVYFLVMNNLFPPHRDIHLKYDLKGSTWGRKAKVRKNDDGSGKTLKDLDWLERGEQIKFGPEKRRLLFDQLDSDVKFLQSVNVMDYSLLIGMHDVKKGNTREDVQKLSIFDPKSGDSYDVVNTNPRDINIAEDLPSSVYPRRLKYIFYGHDGGIRATNEENEPLAEIYYLGIIDYLTNYSLRKRLETVWRSLSHSRLSISAVPAKEYGDRFLKFIKEGTTNVKTKTS